MRSPSGTIPSPSSTPSKEFSNVLSCLAATKSPFLHASIFTEACISCIRNSLPLSRSYDIIDIKENPSYLSNVVRHYFTHAKRRKDCKDMAARSLNKVMLLGH